MTNLKDIRTIWPISIKLSTNHESWMKGIQVSMNVKMKGAPFSQER